MSSFDGASLNDLRAMIANADPNGLDAVASKWSAVHEALRQTQEDLLHHTLAATTHWQGAAADAFSARADELHQSLGNGAAYAFNASSGVSCAAEALRNAQAAMPAEPLTLEGISAAQQATATGVTATQFDEHQRQQAAAVMRRLNEGYTAAGEMIGVPSILERGEDRGTFPRGGTARRLNQMNLAPSNALENPREGEDSPRHFGTKVPPQSIRKPQPSTLSPENLDLAEPATTRLLHDEERPLSAHTDQRLALPTRANRAAVSDVSLAGSSQENRSTLDPTSRHCDSTAGDSLPPLGTFHTKSVPSGIKTPQPITEPAGSSPARISHSHPLSHHQDSEDPSFGKVSPEIIGGIQEGDHTPTRRTSMSLGTIPRGSGELPTTAANGWTPLNASATRRSKSRRRPAYLVEDRESWLPRQPTNPPVIT